MAKCEICSKDMMFGRHISITRSQVSTSANRNWKVNVRRVKIVDDKGVTRYAYVCASCLKSGLVTRAKKVQPEQSAV